MMSDPLSTVYFIFLGLISFLIALFLVLNYRKSQGPVREKFTNVEDKDEYKARLKVIDVFDSYLKRNPTPKEISKYSQFENEQDIMAAVMKDFPQVESAKKGAKKKRPQKTDKSGKYEKKHKKNHEEAQEKFASDDEREESEDEETEEEIPDEEIDRDEEDELPPEDNIMMLRVEKEHADRVRSKIEQIKADVRDIELTFMNFFPSSEKM